MDGSYLDTDDSLSENLPSGDLYEVSTVHRNQHARTASACRRPPACKVCADWASSSCLCGVQRALMAARRGQQSEDESSLASQEPQPKVSPAVNTPSPVVVRPQHGALLALAGASSAGRQAGGQAGRQAAPGGLRRAPDRSWYATRPAVPAAPSMKLRGISEELRAIVCHESDSELPLRDRWAPALVPGTTAAAAAFPQTDRPPAPQARLLQPPVPCAALRCRYASSPPPVVAGPAPGADLLGAANRAIQAMYSRGGPTASAWGH